MKTTCKRCKGTGYIECYKYIQAGVCFSCMGSGLVDTKETIEQKRQDNQKAFLESKQQEYENILDEIETLEEGSKKEYYKHRAEKFYNLYLK